MHCLHQRFEIFRIGKWKNVYTMQCQLLIEIIFLNEELILFARKLKYQISSAEKRIFTKFLLMQVIDDVIRRNLNMFHRGKRLH